MSEYDPHQWFTRMYKERYGSVFRYLLRRVPEPDTANDLAADTFAVAWKKRRKRPLDHEMPWLYNTARQLLANYHRKQRTRSKALPIRYATEPAASDEAPEHELIDEVHHTLDQLSFEDQEILKLSLWEELTADEIATVLNCRAGTARTRLHRAKRRFEAHWHQPHHVSVSTRTQKVAT